MIQLIWHIDRPWMYRVKPAPCSQPGFAMRRCGKRSTIEQDVENHGKSMNIHAFLFGT